MKLLAGVLISFLHANLAFAQADTCSLKVVINNTTHAKRAEINFTVVGTETDNLFCSAFRSGNEFAVYFGLEVLNKTACFRPGARAMILFTDHSQTQVVNIQAPNCNGNFLVKGSIQNGLFSPRDSSLNLLTTKIIRAIRFQTNDGFLDYDVVDEDDRLSLAQAKILRHQLECLRDWKE